MTPLDKWEIVLVDLYIAPNMEHLRKNDVNLHHKNHLVPIYSGKELPFCGHCKELIPEEIVTKYTRISKFLLP